MKTTPIDNSESSRVTKVLFAHVPSETHEAVRQAAYARRQSMASIIREAVDAFLGLNADGEQSSRPSPDTS